MRAKWLTEIPQLAVLLGMFITAAVAWQAAPESLPVHWNIRGEVDRHGGKFEGLLLPPLIAAGLYLLLVVLPHFDPVARNYESFRRAYAVIRLTLMLLMAVAYACILLSTFGHGANLGFIIPIAVGVMFAVLGNVMGKIRPNWFVGVRTPWTLSSRTSWNKTHRLASWLFLAMGITISACGVFQNVWMFGIAGTVIVGSVVWMTVYSYLVWRHDPERLSAGSITPSSDAPELN